MKRISLARTTLLLLLGTSAGALGIMACVSEEPAPAPAAPDGSVPDPGNTQTDSGSNTTNDDGSTSIDAGDPDAGEIITDGGDLPPEEDGGVTDPDGGFDAGPACAPLTPGAYVTSTCASISVLPSGGDLVSGTYVLDSVVVLGTATFCGAGGGFAAYDHRGALEVSATSTTSATFELLDQYKKSGGLLVRPTTVRYDVVANANKSTLTYTPQACALKAAPPSGSYTAGTLKTGKKFITLRLPYGAKGTANYRFVEP